MILKETLLIIREIQVIHKKVISEQCTKCVCLRLLSGHSQSTNQICLHLSDKSEKRSNIILIRESGLLITEALNYLIIVAFKIRYSYLSMDFPLPNGYIYRLVKNEVNKECIFQIKEISDKNQALVSHFIKFKQKIILQEFLGLRCLIFGHNFLIRT